MTIHPDPARSYLLNELLKLTIMVHEAKTPNKVIAIRLKAISNTFNQSIESPRPGDNSLTDPVNIGIPT